MLRTSNSEKERVIIFNYSDGLYFWKVNLDEYSVGTGGRSDRGVEEYYTMAFVKKEYLTNIETLTAER